LCASYIYYKIDYEIICNHSSIMAERFYHIQLAMEQAKIRIKTREKDEIKKAQTVKVAIKK